jgi:hypothetical protein
MYGQRVYCCLPTTQPDDEWPLEPNPPRLVVEEPIARLLLLRAEDVLLPL